MLANGEKLPWTTQVPAVKGLAHWARLDLAVLRLSADGRYTLSYRYAQEVVDTRAPLRMPPARDELSVGRYSGKGKKLTFVPKPSPDVAARTVTAEVVGDDISLDKTVFVGENAIPRPIALPSRSLSLVNRSVSSLAPSHHGSHSSAGSFSPRFRAPSPTPVRPICAGCSSA